jgi:hypothetical protein
MSVRVADTAAVLVDRGTEGHWLENPRVTRLELVSKVNGHIHGVAANFIALEVIE